MVSDEQQTAIDFRRQWVARFLVRGLTQREVQAQIANMTVTGPGGEKVPVCVNPDTGAAWGLTAIHEDVKFLREGWKEAADREVEDRRAELLASVREMRRLAFASNDLKAVATSIKQEREMFGVDAPKTSVVTLAGLNSTATNEDDTALDALEEACAEFGVGPIPTASTQ